MEYLVYILVTLVFGLLCLFGVRMGSRSSNRRALLEYQVRQRQAEKVLRSARAKREASRAGNGSSGNTRYNRLSIERELKQVRTPWGWPNYREFNGESKQPLSLSVQNFADRLMKEKQLAHSPAANSRTSECFKTLMEDRYGRASQSTMKKIRYQRVKPPMLRDPNAPHDQMDNLGTHRAERIRHKLQKASRLDAKAARAAQKKARTVQLKNVKSPWGW